MGQGGLATQLWHARPVTRRMLIVALLILAGLLSYQSIAMRAPGVTVAPWWPAGGVAVFAVLASRGSRLPAALGVVIATLTANLFAGREFDVAVGFATANAVEAYIVAQLASRRGPDIRLQSLREVASFIGAVFLGAAVAGAVAGAGAALTLHDDFAPTAFSFFASHASSVLVIAPIGLVRWRTFDRRTFLEAAVQFLTLLGLTAFVFWPGNTLPLAFMPLTVLLWAAFRLPMTVVAIELVVLAVLSTALMGVGGGAIGSFVEEEPRTASLLLQFFLAVHASVALLVAATRHDWSSAARRLGTRESLLRGGIVNSETGILIAEEVDGERLRVVGLNATALCALGRESMPKEWDDPGLRIASDRPIFGVRAVDEAIVAQSPGHMEIESDGRRFDVALGRHGGDDGASVMTLVFTDVTARDERERRALDAAEQLRDLNRQKDDFISSVSHELRTPVTSILGFVEDLESADLGPDERVATDVIARNARRLADVIEDVLELGKLGSAVAVSRPPSEFDLVALTRHCAQDAEGLAGGRSVRLTVTAPAAPLLIRSVPQDLSRVLANLLSNAVKFTEDDGEVSVMVTSSADGPTITITDHGPGIPPAMLDRVWDRFYRVSDARHRDVQGTGLGLPIVRALVDKRLAGTVELESDGRTGTTARLTLPWDNERAVAEASTD